MTSEEDPVASVSNQAVCFSRPLGHLSMFAQYSVVNNVSRRRPYRIECTGSLLTSEVKQCRARSVLGWGTAWEDLRVLSAFYLFSLCRDPSQEIPLAAAAEARAQAQAQSASTKTSTNTSTSTSTKTSTSTYTSTSTTANANTSSNSSNSSSSSKHKQQRQQQQ